MATNRWTAKAKKTAQVNTVTPANVNIGNTFTLTINGKSETYTAAAATVADVTAGLPPLWNDSNEGEMNEAPAVDSTTLITITAEEPGRPFTQTSSASGGTATLTTATATANVSPNDINNATNWTDGVPTAADSLVLDAGGLDESLWWNLGALSAITVGEILRYRSFTGKIGLPEYNTDGETFFEYRATYLAISSDTVYIEQPSSDGAEHIKLDTGTNGTDLRIIGDGPSTLGQEQMWWKGVHASNVVRVTNGSLAIAPTNLDAATILTLTAENATVRCGGAVNSITTVNNTNSTMELRSLVTTLNQRGEQAVTYKLAGTTTTANIQAGTFVGGVGNITTLTIGQGATIDFSQDAGAVTITNAVTFPLGCKFLDPQARVTFTNGWSLAPGVKLKDVELDFGEARTYTVA